MYDQLMCILLSGPEIRMFGWHCCNKIFGINPTHQNCINEKIKSRLNSRNACHHLVLTHVFQFATKNVKNKIYKTIILPVLCGCETWSLK